MSSNALAAPVDDAATAYRDYVAAIRADSSESSFFIYRLCRRGRWKETINIRLKLKLF